MNWLKQKLTDVIGLDPRSLAVLRIGLGLTLLLDLCIRAMDVRAMYAADGICPMEDSIRMAGPWGWSLHWITGDLWFQWVLWGAALAFAIGVLMGWQSRWMLLCSFVLLASIHTRNPLILNGGDGMFRVLVFWAIFLPLGRVWSLDARRRERKGHPPNLKPVVSVATFCFIVQLCLVYWFAGGAKMNEVWLGFDPADVWTDPAALTSASFGGEAMQRSMNYDIYGKPLAGVLAQMPWLLRFICIGTLVLEIVGPIALFSPFGTRWVRMLLVASFALLHIGIELTLHVGMFSWVALAAWAALLPPMFWESRLWQRWRSAATDLVEKPKLPADSAWWAWTKFLVGHATPAVICASLLVVTVAWNISYSLEKEVKADVQKPIRRVVNATMLRQRWNMFGKPNVTEAWFVYRGHLDNGEVVDVFRDGQPAPLEKPADLSSTYTNHRWRKLHVNLCSSRFKRYRNDVADYVCRHWNETHSADEQIVRLEFYQLREKKEAPQECTNTLCLTIVPERDTPAEDGAAQADGDIAVQLDAKPPY